MKRPIGVRTRLLAAVVLVTFVAVAVLVTAFNVLLASRLSADATAAARARAEAEVGTLALRAGRIQVNEGPDLQDVATQLWIFDASGHVLEAPPNRGRLEAAAAQLTQQGRATKDNEELRARLYAAPVLASGRQIGTVVAAVSTQPYRETRTTALLASLALAGALLLVIALVARWILRAALRPVTEMTESASAWSEHDLERRFHLGTPHDELTELAATFDALLNRLATSLRREQRFAAELSHELRTPLARVSGEAELALSRQRDAAEYREAFAAVSRDVEQMTRTIDSLLAAARHEAGVSRSSCDARSAVEQGIDAVTPVAEARGITIASSMPQGPVRVGADADLVERILHPLLENACQYGRAHVEVSLRANGNMAQVLISDDGPGVAPEERTMIFEAGRRGQAGEGRGESSGLGLALALRVARSAGGNIDVVQASAGATFRIDLPLA